jgi:hypothetical protein
MTAWLTDSARRTEISSVLGRAASRRRPAS